MCGAASEPAGEKRGRFRHKTYALRRCAHCGFAFVQDPDTDYAQLYDEAYYRGEGADKLVDYAFELERPQQTIRQLEWSGIFEVLRKIRPIDGATRWLDYGCGNGGLVRWLARHARVSATGYEEGWIAQRARAMGIPVVSSLTEAQAGGGYDIITAIEVLEHVENPREVLGQISALLKPGGIFFYTTGNLAKHRGALADWGYVLPEIHISFYEPRTLSYLFDCVGLIARPHRWSGGFTRIVRYKILKNLGVRRLNGLQALVPWGPGAYLADRRYGVSDFPMGVKPRGDTHRQAKPKKS